MKNRTNQRIEEITVGTMIVGVDIAKSVHWARFVDYRGMELGKAMSFKNDRQGFEDIVTRIREINNMKILKYPIEQVLIGMEPTGHYWKALAHYLMNKGYRVVGINPYHTKRSKELDDNSPTKSDKKDAITIARLVKDGRFFEPYLPEEEYGELRSLTNMRISVMKRSNNIKNTVTAILDEYFPEIKMVFKHPMKGKACRQILRSCPFPTLIMEMGKDGVLAEIKKAVKKTVGMKKVELIEKQLDEVEQAMEKEIKRTGYAEQLLGIKGIGIVSAASFLGEVGDPLRFQNERQIMKYAGYNLTEDSSGKNKSGTCISKRGRKQLRSILYNMALVMVARNPEMKKLYNYLIARKDNPLKKKQALVVISKKIITVIYSLLKKREAYNPTKVLGTTRMDMIEAA